MNKETIFSEIRSDYVDEIGTTHIDGYKTEDDNEEGTAIAIVVKGEVYYRNPEFQFDPKVKEVVEGVREIHRKEQEGLEGEIKKAITNVYYSSGKPRPEFTGTNAGDKVSLILEGVKNIMNFL